MYIDVQDWERLLLSEAILLQNGKGQKEGLTQREQPKHLYSKLC